MPRPFEINPRSQLNQSMNDISVILEDNCVQPISPRLKSWGGGGTPYDKNKIVKSLAFPRIKTVPNFKPGPKRAKLH